MFSVLAEEGVGTGNKIPMGFAGEGKYGATRVEEILLRG